jgi:hypothetical protein
MRSLNEQYKKDVLDGKFLVITRKDASSHNEVEKNNAAYEEIIQYSFFTIFTG